VTLQRRNDKLHALLDAQIRAHVAAHGYEPPHVTLTHDEIDEWRNQFDNAIPVSILAYRGIPIVETA
jgi:hypothetical protein